MALAESIITSIVSGGATGILGAGISHIADYFKRNQDIKIKELDIKSEKDLREIDAKIMQIEWESRKKIAYTEAETQMDVADTKAFMTALTSEPKRYASPKKFSHMQNWLMVVLDFIRGIIRPGLTLYLCGITTAVYLQAGAIIKMQPIPVTSAVDIYVQITSTVLYLTTCCTLFWFGTRSKEKR